MAIRTEDRGELPGRAVSPWLDGAAGRPRPALKGEHEVDVAIVGAGIIGLTTALLAKRAGASVAVLEARRVAAAASGNNTAKLSSLQGLKYSSLVRSDPDGAHAYAQANEDGIALIARLVEELAIECDFRRRTNYTYAESPEQRAEVEREAEAAREAGLAAEFVEDPPLPFAEGAVALAGQAEFHPVKYLRALADALDEGAPCVYENSRAHSLKGDRVETETGAVRAERIVLATHLPIFDRVGLFARAEPLASYALSARIPRPGPEGMFMSAGSSPYSLRMLPWDGEELLIVGGAGHRIASGDPAASIRKLERYARERFGATEIVHRWDAHDFVAEDGLPYVGAVSPVGDRTLTATGMNKWGLAMGSACAEMLAAAIGGEAEPWPAQFDARRLPRPRAWKTLAKHGAETGVHFIGDRLRRGGDGESVAPGEGRVIGAGTEQRAVFRDREGELHSLSARCTHLGCIVKWNPAGETWDCPCHGSRFAPTGEVLEGPATSALIRKQD